MPPLANEIFSVSKVAEIIHSLVGEIPYIWVKGEVSNLKFHQNGNIYFNLKDEGAKISVAIMHYSQGKANANILKEGIELLVFGKLNYYKKEGYVTFFAEQINPIGEGLLKQKFEELKKKLEAEGLFDRSNKKPIPEYPRVIGVITSPTGAAIRDILNITNRRAPHIPIIIFPVAVQGENASYEISKAIEIANRKFKGIIDVLIVGRGGGSIEDLWSFNEEIVARAIYSSEIPIISAVGHEIDYTIADYVADLRAPTPSAAAEIVTPDIEETKRKISALLSRIEMIVEKRIESLKKTLSLYSIEYLHNRLKDNINQKALFLDNLTMRLNNYIANNILELKHQLQIQIQKLKTLNPEAILKRGYSITHYYDTRENCWKILKTTKDYPKASKFKTRISDGEIITIPSKQENENQSDIL